MAASHGWKMVWGFGLGFGFFLQLTVGANADEC